MTEKNRSTSVGESTILFNHVHKKKDLTNKQVANQTRRQKINRKT